MNDNGTKSISRVRNVLPEVQQVAWELRRQMTLAEVALWTALQNKQLKGLRWRKQHPVRRFVLDFYCASCKLVVELDGAGHDAERDAERTALLETHGYRVLRFPNEAVFNNLPSVLARICEAACPAASSLVRESGPLAPPKLGAGGAF